MDWKDSHNASRAHVACGISLQVELTGGGMWLATIGMDKVSYFYVERLPCLWQSKEEAKVGAVKEARKWMLKILCALEDA